MPKAIWDITCAEIWELQRQLLGAYDGDSYMVDELLEEGYSLEAAQREVRELKTLKKCLTWDLLTDILGDRVACKALKDAILSPNREIIDALIDTAKRLKVRGKPGPNGRMVTEAALATVLKISPATLRSWRCRGNGPRWINVGQGSVRYSLAAVKEFLRIEP
jgi:hypothetical protein